MVFLSKKHLKIKKQKKKLNLKRNTLIKTSELLKKEMSLYENINKRRKKGISKSSGFSKKKSTMGAYFGGGSCWTDTNMLCGRIRSFATGFGKRKKEKKKQKVNGKKGVPHYFKSGRLHKGEYHKMPNGQLHSGKTHTASSQRLYHLNELPKSVQKKIKARMKA